MTEMQREERAFEALVVESMRRTEPCKIEDLQANEKEKAALKLLGSDFIGRLVAGELGSYLVLPDETHGEVALSGELAGGELFRCDGVDEKIADALDEADREIIDRKKRERDGETS